MDEHSETTDSPNMSDIEKLVDTIRCDFRRNGEVLQGLRELRDELLKAVDDLNRVLDILEEY